MNHLAQEDPQPLPSLLASDNASGVHPEVWRALEAANRGHCLAYGNDAWTARMEQCFQHAFGKRARVFAVTTGTAANVLALKGVLASHQAILCADQAHLLVDECGAPENVIGCQLVPIPTRHGKLDLDALEDHVVRVKGIAHHSQPGVVTLAQVTERGTLYQLDELAAVIEVAHRHGMRVHMDGARLANAAAALQVSLKEMTADLGIDVLSFGGTKNGLMMAEAVVVLDPELAASYGFIRKQGMQLVSKQRFIAAQFLAYLQDDLWRRNAEHANAMARLLASGLSQFDEVQLTSAPEANMVFATLPEAWVAPLRNVSDFHVWNASLNEVRLITNFDTRPEDIKRFLGMTAQLASTAAS